MPFRILTALFLSTLLAPLALAQTLDPSFGEGGVSPLTVEARPGVTEATYMADLAVDAKDRVLFATWSQGTVSGSTYFGRILPDGSADPAFGQDGVARLITPEFGQRIYRIAVLPDDTFLAAGATNPFPGDDTPVQALLVRASETGARPETIWTYDLGTFTRAFDVAPAGPNRYALAVQYGSPSGLACGVLVVDTDGVPDRTFGDDGLAVLNPGACAIRAVAYNGEALYAAGTTGNGFDRDVFVTRILADGTVDTAFGEDGYVVRGFFGIPDAASDLTIGPDGDVLLTGTTSKGERIGLFLLRLNADGTPDTFGDNGVVFASGETVSYSGFLEVGPFGRILPGGDVVVASTALPDGGRRSLALHRFLRDGNLDPDFGTLGVYTFDYPGAPQTYGEGLAVDDQGRIVFGGATALVPVGGIARTFTFVGRLEADTPAGLAASIDRLDAGGDLPASGGRIRYGVEIANPTTETLTTEYWVDGVFEDGRFRRIVRPVTVTLAPGEGVQETYGQSVVGRLPAGTYEIVLRTGAFPAPVESEASFAFEKLPASASQEALAGSPEVLLGTSAPEASGGPAPVGALAIGPNPTWDRAVVEIAHEAETPIRVRVVDTLGRVIHAETRPAAPSHVLALQTRTWAAGAYTVIVEAGVERFSSRLTVLR